MSAYQIDYSEPLRPSFSIPTGGLNGPGGSAANSTLRLYGRSALEWGEAVDENQLRLSENFASASPPSSAISGQFWIETQLYYHNTSVANSTGWYRWNFATSTWSPLNGNTNVATVEPSTPAQGQYYYGTRQFDGETITGLWGYYQLGRYEPVAWLPRATMLRAGTPASTLVPAQILHLRDGNANTTLGTRGGWVVPSATNVGATPPGAPQDGMLWYQPSSGILRVYSANTAATGLARWHDILGPSLGTVPVTKSNIDMNGNKLLNLATPTVASDAATKQYVDGLISGSVSGYLPLSGGTITGNLTVNGATTVNGFSVNGTAGFNSSVIFGVGLTSYSTINVTGSKVINVATPTVGTDAVNKTYADGLYFTIQANYLPLTGGTLSGNLTLNGVTTFNNTVNSNASIVLTGGSQLILPNAPAATNHAANKAYVDSVVSGVQGIPAGCVVAYGGTGIPVGWLECNGQTLNRAGTYAALFSAIGGQYGAPSGTTFRVPDLRGQFVRGWANSGSVDAGRGFGTNQADEVRSHTHSYFVGPGVTASITADKSILPSGPSAYGSYTSTATGGTETRPTNVAMFYIIKY